MTTEHPLIAFYAARLDEEEASARAAADSSGNLEWFDSLVQASGDHTVRTRPGSRPVARIRLCDSQARDGRTLNPEAAAGHIVRHDPAKVLASVLADRHILGRHTALQSPVTPMDRVAFPSLAEVVLACIRDRAARFKDHPDYDPAWSLEMTP